ncbi:MAG: PH domain-containing protein [Candidatus Nanopelagicales bacterium]
MAPGLIIFFFVFGGEGVTDAIGRIGAGGLIALALIVSAAASWWSWTRLTYWFDEAGDFRIRSGIWQHRETRIQVSRLQSVDVSQPLLARIAGLAQVRPEVAGSSSEKTALEYLGLDDANRLRAELLARAAGISIDAGGAAPVAPERVLAQVAPGMLFASVLLQPATLIALLVVPVALVAAFAFGAWQVSLPLLFVLTAPLIVASNQFLNWFNFTVAESPDGLRLRFGLTSHRLQTVPPGRVQAVRLESPLLWKPWGWAKVTVNVAGTSGREDASAHPAVVLPVASLEVARAVLAQALPGIDPFIVPLSSVSPRARWRSPLQFRRLAVGSNDQVFVTRHGWLVPMWDVVPHARTQSVRMTQGPWQRRLHLASVHVDSTPGPVRITAAHRDANEARVLVEAQVVAARHARARAAPDRWLLGDVTGRGLA